MPQSDHEASNMKKAPIHNKDAVVTHRQTTEKTQPGVGSLDYPAPAIAPQLAFVVIGPVFLVAPIWCDQLSAAPLQSPPQRITIVSLVRDYPSHTLARSSPRTRNFDLVKRGFCQLRFMPGRSFQENSKRNTLAINHNHPL